MTWLSAGLGELTEDVETTSDLFGDNATTDDGLNTIATALRLIAALAALAGAAVLALAITRAIRLGFSDRGVLVALGWTNGQLVNAGCARVLTVAAPRGGTRRCGRCA